MNIPAFERSPNTCMCSCKTSATACLQLMQTPLQTLPLTPGRDPRVPKLQVPIHTQRSKEIRTSNNLQQVVVLQPVPVKGAPCQPQEEKGTNLLQEETKTGGCCPGMARETQAQ